jgi:tRNA(His) guanylyltransferase
MKVKQSKDSLGDRMKTYERVNTRKLTRRIPVIIRIDMRAGHTLTRGCDKPFDRRYRDCMVHAMFELFTQAQGAKLAYTQSDEISLVLTDYDTLVTEAWFAYNVDKLNSVTSSIVTASFNIPWLGEWFDEAQKKMPGTFDARCFNIPIDDVANYFLWRMKDWERNSVSMYARSFYSHNELKDKSQSDMHEMLYMKGKNWAIDLEPMFKNGTFIYKIEDTLYEDSFVNASYPHINELLQKVGLFNG